MIQQHDCHKAQRKWFLRIKVLLKEGKNLFRIVLGDFQRGAEAVTDRPIIDLRQKGFRIGKNLFQPHPRIRMRISRNPCSMISSKYQSPQLSYAFFQSFLASCFASLRNCGSRTPRMFRVPGSRDAENFL